MNVPNIVRIGSMDYSVELTKETIIVAGRECFGSIDYNMKKIVINSELQDIQGLEQTLLHEIVHGIVFERNFSYTNNDEETVTDELSRGLHQIIRDNSELFQPKILIKEKKK